MITKKMTLGKIIQKYPQTTEIFFRYGLACFGCHIAGEETLEQGAKAHGISGKNLEKLIEELNKVVK